MIKPIDALVNPVRWVPVDQFDAHLEMGYVYAVDFYRQKEAKYATLRRELEKQMVIDNVEG